MVNGKTFDFELCEFPASLSTSRVGTVNFFRLHAGRIFGGREGRDWRVCVNSRQLIPESVNQLVTSPNGGVEFGDQLIVQ